MSYKEEESKEKSETKYNKEYNVTKTEGNENKKPSNTNNEQILKDLCKAENYKSRLANKDTSYLIAAYISPHFKKENFSGNSNKINNMTNPYNHLEFFPSSKEHNFKKDNFKKHSEDVLRFRHLMVKGVDKKNK